MVKFERERWQAPQSIHRESRGYALLFFLPSYVPNSWDKNGKKGKLMRNVCDNSERQELVPGTIKHH